MGVEHVRADREVTGAEVHPVALRKVVLAVFVMLGAVGLEQVDDIPSLCSHSDDLLRGFALSECCLDLLGDAAVLDEPVDVHTPYLFISPPKSTGPELFNIDWLKSLLEQLPKYRPVDIQATLLEFTAQTISQALSLCSYNINEVFICGGGAYNTVLINRLKELVAPVIVENTSILGIAPEWVEASAFAWLAKQTVEGLPGNMPAATGAEKSAVLGAIYTK